jgi:hypothetical protein
VHKVGHCGLPHSAAFWFADDIWVDPTSPRAAAFVL